MDRTGEDAVMSEPYKATDRIIQEFVPGKQVTLAHLIAHPEADLSAKIGVPGAQAIGILTLTPGETAMIAGDIATKAAQVQIGFLDRFTGALVVHGSVGAVDESLRQVLSVLGDHMGYAVCRITKT
jgi:ethanolamine utilization protein EutS